MKKGLLFLSLLFCVQLASAQDTIATPISNPEPIFNTKPSFKRNTFTLSYSPTSIEGLRSSFRRSFETFSPIIIEGEYGFAAVGYNNPTYSGVFMLSYTRRFFKKLEMTFDVGYEQEWKDWKLYNNPLQITEKLERDHYLYLMLNTSLVFLSKEHVDMFTSIGFGSRIIWDNAAQLDKRIESSNSTDFAFQLWFFGIRLKYLDWCGVIGSVGVGTMGFVRIGLFASW